MATDLIIASFNFIEEHVVDIILVILVLFLIISYNIMNNISAKKNTPVLQRVVVVENMESKRKGICNGGLMDIDNNCKGLVTKGNCNLINCCVWARKDKKSAFSCVGGDSGGPTYDGGKYDEYYYKNKRYVE